LAPVKLGFLCFPASSRKVFRDVFVQYPGNQGLVRHAFFQRLGLNVLQVAGGKADVDSLIVDGGSSRGSLECRQFSLAGDGNQFTLS
jgi:hypothetical protein